MKRAHLLVFFVSGSNLFGQCGTLSGRVLDKDDKQPLEFANIFIMELQKGASSSEKGEFKIEEVCDGKYTIKISHAGCEPRQEIVEVKGNTKVKFSLPRSATVLKEVSISTKRAELQPTQVHNNITGKALEDSKGESLGEALKNVTGVKPIIVCGLHPKGVCRKNDSSLFSSLKMYPEAQ